MKTRRLNTTDLQAPTHDKTPAAALDIGERNQAPEPAALPRLAYSMKETAEILGVSYITVQRLLLRGLLRNSSALRHKVIPLSETQRFLKATTA
jgi:hypothetical protein